MSEVERLLREALTPVEPPEGMIDRVERRLTELSDAAVEELADWELGAMCAPSSRRWQMSTCDRDRGRTSHCSSR